jgi:2-hydroxychromene-2-carboxylate isomerase
MNADALSESGHWGVPTMVYGGETFFGQDRVDVLTWHINNRLSKSLGNNGQ